MRAECLSPADLHRAREKQTATFTLFCKDAAGESMGRGGDDIRVTVVPNDKKDRLVLHSQVSRVKSTDETGNLRSFAIGGMLTAVVTSYLPTMLFNNVIGPAGPDVFSCVGFRPIFNFSQRSDLPLRLSSPQALNRLKNIFY